MSKRKDQQPEASAPEAKPAIGKRFRVKMPCCDMHWTVCADTADEARKIVAKTLTAEEV